MSTAETLYLKIDRNIRVKGYIETPPHRVRGQDGSPMRVRCAKGEPSSKAADSGHGIQTDDSVRHAVHVQLGEIAQFYCAEKAVVNKVKTLRLPTGHMKKPGRYVYSILDVIEVIQQEYPKLEINNLGETDFILTLEKTPTGTEFWSWIKTVLICVLSFFGAAFSIMAFNTDVGITDLFGKLYKIFTGVDSNGFTLLEISYSVGVGLGILIFFHHFARKRNRTDPTPLQVQMRAYEDDVNATLIEAEERSPGAGRKKGE